MALAQTRPGPSVRPVMVHGASATTQFMRAATGTADPTQQQQQGKGRVPADAGRQKPPAPIGSSRIAACTSAERHAARRDATRRQLPGRSGGPASCFCIGPGRDPNPGRPPVSSTYPNRSVRALFSLSVLSLSPSPPLVCVALRLTVYIRSRNVS